MIIKYLVAAAVVMGAPSSVSAQSVKAGIDAWRKGDYPAAVAIWRPIAERGDADAQFDIGQAYRLGRGVPTNLSTAKGWLEKAASQGHVDAETTLGLLLFQNGEQGAGLKWLKLAAEQGEPRAMLVYGTALFNGDSVTQNPVLGYAFVSRADAQGLPAAKDVVGQLDRLMSVADRKRAKALAQGLEKSAGRLLFTAEKPAQSARTRPAKPIVTAAEKPVAKPAPPQNAPVKSIAAATVPASGAWRIQLGAFSQRGSAEALYKKLAASPALAGRSPFYIPAGTVTRLQIGPFASRPAAAAACAAVELACFPVASK